MKRRILSLLLAVALLCALLPQTALFVSAASYSGTCGGNLTWTLDTGTGKLVISGSGAMKNYSYFNEAPWDSYRSSIKRITIGNSVTSIGEWAFENCTGLTSITIPDSVTSIGHRAFFCCTGLTGITIPDSVTSIGYEAFFCCTGLTRISVSDENSSYDSRNDCNGIIKTATNTLICGGNNTKIPDSVTSIGDWAFYNCTGLTSVTIPDSVTNIGQGAFKGCTGLTSITIPDSVTSIGYEAFADCTGLTSITIPDSVTSIVPRAFDGCTGLKSITIPNSVTSIDNYAFSGCTGLTGITIPDSVTSIGNAVFSACNNLSRISVLNPACVIYDRSSTTLGVAGTTTIYGYSGSTAQTYANKHKFDFVSLDSPTSNIDVTASNPASPEIVSNVALENWANSQSNVSLTLGDNLEGPTLSLFGYKIPLFRIGTTELKINGIKGISVTAQADAEKKTIKVILGYTDKAKAELSNGKDNRTKYAEEYQDLKEFFKLLNGKDISNGNTAAWNKYQRLRSNLQDKVIGTDGSLGVKATIKVVGYLELSYESGDLQVKEGGITVIGEAGVTARYQPSIVYVELGIKGTAEIGMTMEPAPESKIGTKLSGVKGAFQLGLCPVCGVGVKGKKLFGLKLDLYLEGGAHGSLNFDIDSRDPNASKLYLAADVYIEGKAGPFKKTLTKKIGKYYLIPKGYTDETKRIQTSFDEQDFQPIPRGYLNEHKRSLSISDAELLLCSVYPYAEQQLIALPDGKEMLIYIGDDGKKADNDRSTVFYRILENGVWSAEQPVYESGTYMDAAQVVQTNGHTYVLWMQADRSFSDENPEPEEILSACDLYLSEYTGSAFTEPVCISGESDGTYKSMFTLIEGESGDLDLFWVQNSSSVFGNEGTNELYHRSCSNGVWTEQEKIYETTDLIAAISAARVDGNTLINVVLGQPTGGTDDEADTLQYLNQFDLTNKTMTLLCSEPITAVQQHENCLYYVVGNELFCYSLQTGEAINTGLTDVSEFVVASNGDSTAIVSTVYDGLKNELFASYGNGSEWSEWEQLTSYGGYLRSVSSLMNDDGSLKLAVNYIAVEENTDGSLYYADSSDLIISGKTEFIDLGTECLTYNEDLCVPNGETEFTVSVKNYGNTTAKGCTVSLLSENAEILASQHFDAEIAAGETVELSISYCLPDKIGGLPIYAELSADGQDRNADNNHIETQIGLADLKLHALEVTPNSCVGAAYSGTVSNDGFLPAEDVVLQIYSDPEFTELVKTESLGNLSAKSSCSFAFELPDTLLTVTQENTLNALYAVVTTTSSETKYANNEDKAVFGTVENPHSPATAVRENDKAATCTEAGGYEEVVYCQLCGAELSRESFTIQASGHSYVVVVTTPTCTDGGYTTYTCSACSDSYTEDETVALGHSYTYTDNGDGTHTVGCANCDYSAVEDHTFTDGSCVCGATEEPAMPTDSTLVYRVKSLSLQSYVAENLMVQNKVINNFDGGVYVVFERYDYKDQAMTTQTVYGVPVTGTTNTQFEYKVFSYMMADEITATLYGVKGGVTYKGESYTTSVADYVMTKMAAGTDAYRTLYANMLNYGANAQRYYNGGYNTDNLATSVLGEYASYITAENATTSSIANEIANDGATVTKQTVALGIADSVQLQYILRVPNALDVNDLHAVLTFTRADGTVVTQTLEGSELVSSGSTSTYKRYTAVFNSLTAKDGRVTANITVYDANDNPVSNTWVYSIESYIAEKSAATAGTVTGDTLQALMNYLDAASAIFNS